MANTIYELIYRKEKPLKFPAYRLRKIYWISSPPLISFAVKTMDRHHRPDQGKITTPDNEEVTSMKWEFIRMTEQEEDLIYRMHRLVGDSWELIAARIPGRKAVEIERFWIMRHNEGFAQARKEHRGKELKTKSAISSSSLSYYIYK